MAVSVQDYIVSLNDSSPKSIAHNLSLLCQRVEEQPTSGWHGKSHLKHYLSDDPPFPFIDEIWGLLQKTGVVLKRKLIKLGFT